MADGDAAGDGVGVDIIVDGEERLAAGDIAWSRSNNLSVEREENDWRSKTGGLGVRRRRWV